MNQPFVFPAHWQFMRLSPGLKVPAERVWQHNPRTFDQTNERHRGIHVGASRLIIIDEDEHGAIAAWLQSIGQSLPDTLIVQTASGKYHHYYSLPDHVYTWSVSTRLKIDKFRVDLLAGMRYVPAPGAWIADAKKPPRWQGLRQYFAYNSTPIAVAPDWLIARIPVGQRGTYGTSDQVDQLHGKLDDPEGKPCAWMEAVVKDWVAKIQAAGPHCHEEGLHAAWAVARDAAKGHRGAYTAMNQIRDVFLSVRQPTIGTADYEWYGRDTSIEPGAWAKAANEEFDSFWDSCTCFRDITDYNVPPETIQAVQPEQNIYWQNTQQPLEPVRVANEHYAAPIEHLPEPLKTFVVTTARYSQTVPEMALLGALCSLSFATGGNLLVQIEGHAEPVTLWAVLTALPSQRKSGALSAAVRSPMTQAIQNYWTAVAEEQTRLKDELDVLGKQIKKTREDIANGKVEDRDQAYDDLTNMHEEVAKRKAKVIRVPVWDVSDTTVEGLEKAMEATGGPIASFADEAALLATVAGRYSTGKARITLSSLNSAHGRSPINTIRAGESRSVDNPHLVLCQLIQPGPFGSIMSALGEVEDGFLSRFLYSDPAPYGPRVALVGIPDSWVSDRWAMLLTDVLMEYWHRPDGQPKRMTLSPGALQHYVNIYPYVDYASRSWEKVNGTFSQWLGKAVNAHIVRIAAMFQLVLDHKSPEISEEAMGRAVAMFGWLQAEALKAMRTLREEQIRPDAEQDILSWFYERRTKDRAKGGDVMEYVSARDIKRGRQRFRRSSTEEIEALLMMLEDQHWLERVEKKGVRPAAPLWHIRADFETKWLEPR